MSNQKYISDALRRKKQKVKKIKTYSIFFLVLVSLVAFVYVLRLPYFQVAEVKIHGNVFVETQEIQQQTWDLLNKNILWIIPNKNIFLFSKRKLEESIKSNPAIISVKIRKDFFHTLSIEIQEQEKEMIYCTSLEKTECFYINKKGFIYAKIDDIIIPEQEIIIYNEKEKKSLKDTLINEETYTDIVLFVRNLARQEIKIKEVYIKADSTVDFVTWDNTRFVTSIFDEYKKDFANLMALFDQQVVIKEQLSNVEYIDLRFGNKVFYKNKTN